MWPNLQKTAELVTFTEEIFDGKLKFLCSESLLNLKKKNSKKSNLKTPKILPSTRLLMEMRQHKLLNE